MTTVIRPLSAGSIRISSSFLRSSKASRSCLVRSIGWLKCRRLVVTWRRMLFLVSSVSSVFFKADSRSAIKSSVCCVVN
jgi:hypothetical protein